MFTTRLFHLGAILASLSWASAARTADNEYVLNLATGGQIRGKLLNVDETPRKRYILQTSFGGKITLDRDQVREVSLKTARQVEYERKRPTFADTVEAQWELSEWCRKNLMSAARKTHLRRILDLEPNHEEARRAPGYFKHEGQWVTQEQLMTRRGYVQYGSRWMLPQEVRLKERGRKQELAEKEWFRRLKLWRGWLSGPKSEQIQREISAIKDPYAVKALQYYMEPAKEPNARVRDLYVDALANVSSGPAMQTLLNASLYDPDEEVRLSSIEYLAKQKNPEIVRRYVKLLKDSNNVTINRAALALGNMKDPTSIGPLIDALITQHKFKVVSGSGGTSASFSPNGGGGGLSVGRNTQIYVKQIQNEVVRNALVAMTGVNFNYNIPQWRDWYATQRRGQEVNTRRD